MTFKMKGFSGFKSPLKQDYKVLDDKELEESRKRMNSRADAIEKMKNMKGLAARDDEDMRIMKKGDKLGPTPSSVVDEIGGGNEPGKVRPWEKAKEKVKK